MDEVAGLLGQMRALEPHVHVYGPAPEAAIRQLEAAFARPMPATYRAFLARFGGVSIVDTSYSGVIGGRIDGGRGWAWTDTRCARDWCRLPDHYLVVGPDQDGFVCLDFSRAGPGGEHPVIYHMPFRRTPFNELGPSYGAYLAAALRAMVEAWAEDQEPAAAPDPRWWTADAVALARGIAADRAWGRLPVLADALLEAGCEHPAVLDHCRQPESAQGHSWVVDMLLGPPPGEPGGAPERTARSQ